MSQTISKKICIFSKNARYLFRKIFKHDNNHYKQALVVAQYQILIMCYSAMFRNGNIIGRLAVTQRAFFVLVVFRFNSITNQWVVFK